MKITAITQEDFDKQYHSKLENLPLNEVKIDLVTNDIFWNLISKEEISNQLLQVSLLTEGANVNNSDIKAFYHPRYGQIRRL